MSQEFVVAPEEAGVRIDRYLSGQCQDISRSYLQKLLKEQSVLVEEKPVKSNYKVNAGDRISLTLPEIREPEIMPENIPLDIIYEDKDIILINKPKGW